jgi:CubicO group peptidase (beta-lactamase class C family)
MLVDEGKLNWDDPVIKFMRDFQMYDPYVTREITIRDLLTHRSGLPTFGGDHLWIGSSLTREEIIHRLRFLKPDAPFRARFQCQNLMFLVERIIRGSIVISAAKSNIAKCPDFS